MYLQPYNTEAKADIAVPAQRYISTRRMFVDPKELALGHSEPVVDTNTALAAKRRLGTLYKSILFAVRQEAKIMQAVFAKPQEALMAFVQRLFEQRIQVCLDEKDDTCSLSGSQYANMVLSWSSLSSCLHVDSSLPEMPE